VWPVVSQEPAAQSCPSQQTRRIERRFARGQISAARTCGDDWMKVRPKAYIGIVSIR
jgi:hypothetical protein